MDKKLKIILGLTIATLAVQVLFSLLLLKLLLPANVGSGQPGDIATMSREERLELLEKIWQSADFKQSTLELRRKAFESIVVK
ncbi:MAG: hypothetical protein Q7T49_01120 [bacterium]|nr:hypothetical protein [bacterium]